MITIDLNFLHFIVTVCVLLFLIVSSYANYHKKRRRYDESFSQQWGLVGYVSRDGRYISRVPSKQEDQ